MFTQSDVAALEEGYLAAKAMLDQVTHPHGYPNYPAEISTFMKSLTSKPWGNTAYDPSKTMELLAHLDSAEPIDIRSILTAFGRGERFGDGYWIAMLESDHFPAVIARAKELAQPDEAE